MNRKITISSCDDCPFFANEYYGYDEICTVSRVRVKGNNGVYEIPETCQLQITTEAETEVPD